MCCRDQMTTSLFPSIHLLCTTMLSAPPHVSWGSYLSTWACKASDWLTQMLRPSWSFSDNHVSIFVCCLWCSVMYFVSNRREIKGACSGFWIHVLGLVTIHIVLSASWPSVQRELGPYFVLSMAWCFWDDQLLWLGCAPFSVVWSAVKHFWTTWTMLDWLADSPPFCKDSMQNDDGAKSWQPQSHRIQEGKSRSCHVTIFPDVW